MITYTKLVLWALDNCLMWVSFHSRERILEIFHYMYLALCEDDQKYMNYKKKEREKIALAFQKRQTALL